MDRRTAFHVIVGAAIASVITAGIYLWLHHRYAFGVDPAAAVILVAMMALLGGAIGLLTKRIQRRA